LQAKGRIAADNEDAAFTRTVNLSLQNYLDEDSYWEQLTYIRNIKKPLMLNGELLDVNQFYYRVALIVRRMTYFPGAPATPEDVLSPRDFRGTLFTSMPMRWQEQWINNSSSTNYTLTPINDLVKHFQNQWQQDRHRENIHLAIDDHADDRTRDYKETSNSRWDKRSRGGQSHAGQNDKYFSNNNSRVTELTNQCRYHPTHPHNWEDCRGNKNSRNYRQKFVLPALGTSNRPKIITIVKTTAITVIARPASLITLTTPNAPTKSLPQNLPRNLQSRTPMTTIMSSGKRNSPAKYLIEWTPLATKTINKTNPGDFPRGRLPA
jgi:hypothetical protein